MRRWAILIGAAGLLAGCSWPEWMPGSTGGSGWGAQSAGAAPSAWSDGGAQPDMPQELRSWEAEWAEAKAALAETRETAREEGTPVPPQVDAAVTEVVNREVTEQGDAARLQRLQDSVSDARRLAEIVGAG